MASAEATPVEAAQDEVPELHVGDRLTRAEFERRYEAMPRLKKAELIETVVYLPSYFGQLSHARSLAAVVGWLGNYCSGTPGAEGGTNGTVRMDLHNEPQPDAILRVLPECAGQSRDDDEYIGGAPELISEVVSNSASYDLHDKFRVYERNGVREYIVWRVHDKAIDWFVLRDERFQRLLPDGLGLVKSETFPGLWLDPAALIARDHGRVMAVLQQGLASPAHAAFLAELQAARGPDST